MSGPDRRHRCPGTICPAGDLDRNPGDLDILQAASHLTILHAGRTRIAFRRFALSVVGAGTSCRDWLGFHQSVPGRSRRAVRDDSSGRCRDLSWTGRQPTSNNSTHVSAPRGRTYTRAPQHTGSYSHPSATRDSDRTRAPRPSQAGSTLVPAYRARRASQVAGYAPPGVCDVGPRGAAVGASPS